MTSQTAPPVSAAWAHESGLVDLKPVGAGSRTISPADRCEIEELFARYAVAYDEHRLDVLRSCFADDAEYQVHLGPTVMARFEGGDAIASGIGSVIAEQGPAQRRHHMTNVILDPVADDTVDATAYAIVGVADETGPSLSATAIYHAKIRRAGMFWQFSTVLVGLDSYAGQAPRR